MNRLKLRLMMCTMFLALGVMWMASGDASAQTGAVYQPGDSWHGFSWNTTNTVSEDARLAIWSVTGKTFTGGVSLFGKGRAVGGKFSTDGSVDVTELNSTVPIMMHGQSTFAADGSVSTLFTLSQGGRSLGMARLLRLFPAGQPATGAKGPVDPYFPPGPCYVGDYIGMDNMLKPATLTFNPTSTNTTTDRPQPADFTGTLQLGGLSYTFVLCIDRNSMPNGNYKFDMIAHAVNTVVPCIRPVEVIPCVRVSGEFHPSSLIPCIRAPQQFAGLYQMFNSKMALADTGKISVSAQ